LAQKVPFRRLDAPHGLPEYLLKRQRGTVAARAMITAAVHMIIAVARHADERGQGCTNVLTMVRFARLLRSLPPG
jgi:hypothetical protein